MIEITSSAEIADLLKALRKDQGLSQAQVAQAVGVSRPMITYFENKSVFMKFNDLLTLMHSLGVKLYME